LYLKIMLLDEPGLSTSPGMVSGFFPESGDF